MEVEEAISISSCSSSSCGLGEMEKYQSHKYEYFHVPD